MGEYLPSRRITHPSPPFPSQHPYINHHKTFGPRSSRFEGGGGMSAGSPTGA